jgi:IclR family KDG regulon transcriptional repressor
MIIQSVHRALQVLNLFSTSRPRLGISEISRALGLHKGTVQGLIRTLAQEGFLEQDSETRKYKLGLKVYELGATFAGTLEINQMAGNAAHGLAAHVRKLVRVAVRQGDQAIITLDAYPRSQPFLYRQFGLNFPLYCTAMGKALLAHFEGKELEGYLQRTELVSYTRNTITDRQELAKELKETRERGYSVNREEHLLGRGAIGAPIFDRQGNVSASMCIVGRPNEILRGAMKKFCDEVINSSSEISRNLGYFPKGSLPNKGSVTI